VPLCSYVFMGGFLYEIFWEAKLSGCHEKFARRGGFWALWNFLDGLVFGEVSVCVG
jgi:hypothetical protein